MSEGGDNARSLSPNATTSTTTHLDMPDQLEAMTVAMLATHGFEEVELTDPRDALEEAGAEASLVAPQADSIQAWDVDDWGESYDVDMELENARPDDFDALLLPGGVLNPDQLRMNNEAVDFVATFVESGKPVASICHGPWMLAEADVVEGRTMTSYLSIRTDLRNAGANVVDEEAVTDDNLVTSRNPDDLPAFNDAMITLFSTATREAGSVAS